MGHALSLKHIDSVAPGGVYKQNTSVLSVMNYNPENTTHAPSWLDKESLILKWGE